MAEQDRAEPARHDCAVALIFDVDGVLVESPHERAWRESLAELLAGDWRELAPTSSFSLAAFSTNFYQRHVAGKPRQSGACTVLDYFGIPDEDHRAAKYAERKQAYIVQLIAAGEFEAFPDALHLVAALRRSGVPMAAASSSKNANTMMAQIHLVPAFSDVGGASSEGPSLLNVFRGNVCGRDVEHGKPFPDLFLLAARELGVSPERCIVVEDATAGVEAAKAGGMRAIGVARLDDSVILQDAGADLVVTTLNAVALDALVNGRLARIV